MGPLTHPFFGWVFRLLFFPAGCRETFCSPFCDLIRWGRRRHIFSSPSFLGFLGLSEFPNEPPSAPDDVRQAASAGHWTELHSAKNVIAKSGSAAPPERVGRTFFVSGPFLSRQELGNQFTPPWEPPGRFRSQCCPNVMEDESGEPPAQLPSILAEMKRPGKGPPPSASLREGKVWAASAPGELAFPTKPISGLCQFLFFSTDPDGVRPWHLGPAPRKIRKGATWKPIREITWLRRPGKKKKVATRKSKPDNPDNFFYELRRQRPCLPVAQKSSCWGSAPIKEKKKNKKSPEKNGCFV